MANRDPGRIAIRNYVLGELSSILKGPAIVDVVMAGVEGMPNSVAISFRDGSIADIDTGRLRTKTKFRNAVGEAYAPGLSEIVTAEEWERIVGKILLVARHVEAAEYNAFARGVTR